MVLNDIRDNRVIARAKREEIKALKKTHDKNAYDLRCACDDQVCALKSKLSLDTTNLNNNHAKAVKDVGYAEYESSFGKMTDIFDMMEVISKEHEPFNIEIYKMRTVYSPIDTLIDKSKVVLKAYIVENQKPKNKYSLVVYGDSIYGSKLYNNCYYISGIHERCVTFGSVLKDFPTEREAQAYYDKLGKTHKNVKEIVGKITTLEYLEQCVREQTNNVEWEIEYLEHKKQHAEHSYGYAEREEYKEILKKLETLRK